MTDKQASCPLHPANVIRRAITFLPVSKQDSPDAMETRGTVRVPGHVADGQDRQCPSNRSTDSKPMIGRSVGSAPCATPGSAGDSNPPANGGQSASPRTWMETYRSRKSWRERLQWIRDRLTDPGSHHPEPLCTVAIYLRLLATGELRCEEDGRHFRPQSPRRGGRRR